ncbi:hypothetical protein NCAS_0A05820 [Naumovozyma castellii]|uniref:Exoribonuclease phosphorolytic domain-containing protein n=1 Tax=Naumovozyma castellii TaxID=27288 RepID=G0V6P4_NAUCA|nr:hypothetical protein NCAS_0A05820 [Naumovozyma castellii CBS 4309]CCC67140.1 hypothetical protein NCAS_0A05820 [Naumovozyma castellii CBS 4309]
MNVQDRRRLLGPSAAKPIVFTTVTSETTKVSEQEQQEQKQNETAALTIKSGVVENCNGSTLIESSKFSLLTSVYGPKSIRGSFTSQGTITIQLKNGVVENYQTTELKEVSSWLVGIFNSVVNLENYPKSGIDIFVNLIIDKQGDISKLIPFLIMGICLALVDGGIEIIDIVTGGEVNGNVVSFTRNGEEIVGFWKDHGEFDNNDDDLMNDLEKCKKQYLEYKNLMINYLLEQKKQKDNS